MLSAQASATFPSPLLKELNPEKRYQINEDFIRAAFWLPLEGKLSRERLMRWHLALEVRLRR